MRSSCACNQEVPAVDVQNARNLGFRCATWQQTWKTITIKQGTPVSKACKHWASEDQRDVFFYVYLCDHIAAVLNVIGSLLFATIFCAFNISQNKSLWNTSISVTFDFKPHSFSFEIHASSRSEFHQIINNYHRIFNTPVTI